MLLRSHDAWHSDLSSSCGTEQCSDVEKDSKNVSQWLPFWSPVKEVGINTTERC